MRGIILSLLILFTGQVLAKDSTISWVPPTENTDGSSLDQATLDYYTIYWSCDTGAGTLIVYAPATQKVTDALLGNCEVSMDVTTKSGISSDKSEVLSVYIKLPTPSYGGFR